ncbi:MAG: hypothetical protein JW720_16245 [Sedimentisphaerales bacterium]|nr:hypothetical protein [Sedimentisphaerales bacterium]
MDTNEPRQNNSEYISDSTPTSGNRNWKSAIFVAMLILAGAVAAHSVLKNGGACSPCGFAGSVCSIDRTDACPVRKANSDCTAACPVEKCDGDCATCPVSKCDRDCSACPMGEAAGCCPSSAPADTATQPVPAGGCCPGCPS